jgi:metal-dependent amidase/aminoacylase/carboxypeptidase family protein
MTSSEQELIEAITHLAFYAGWPKAFAAPCIASRRSAHPIAAYALHVTSGTVPRGTFTTRPGPLQAASDTLSVTVQGAGGHGSAPYRAKDPIPAACEMVMALQTMLT